jgi:DNA polymerase
MTPNSTPSLADELAAAIAWWAEAGVDRSFADEPRGWLAEPPSAAPPAPAPQPEPPAPPVAPIGGLREQWPSDLAAFCEWWLNEPSLDHGGLAPRVAPRGQAGAPLMVIVGEPEETDTQTLLSGPHGRFLDAFLGAAGLGVDEVYRASALPRHTPLADWPRLADEGLGAVLAHHVALVAPQRVLVFGDNLLPLCSHDPAQSPDTLRFFNHEGGRVAAMAARSLESLLRSAGLRERFWRSWLDWTGGD